MKKHGFWFLLILLPLVFSSTLLSNNREFEGILTYKITYEKGQVAWLGVKQFLFYKEGYMRLDRINTAGDLIYSEIYRKDENNSYILMTKSGQNGYLSHDCSINTVEKVGKGITVENSEEGKVLTVHTKFTKEFREKVGLSEDNSEFKTRSYFTKEFLINPEDCKFDNDGFMNEIRSLVPFLASKIELTSVGDATTTTITLIKAEKKTLPMKVFEIDRRKPIQKI